MCIRDRYFTVNNKLKDSMAVTYKVKDGDVLRFQFSLLAGIDVKGNKNVEISNKDELIKLMAKVNADKEKYMAMPAVKEAYEEAVAANVAMITPQKEIDALVKKLQRCVQEPGFKPSRKKRRGNFILWREVRRSFHAYTVN